MSQPVTAEKLLWCVSQSKSAGFLKEQLAHHTAMHIGESYVAAPEAIGKRLVVYPKKVEKGGVEIMHLHSV